MRNEVWGWNAGEGRIKRRIYVFLYFFLANPLICSRFPAPYTSSSCNLLRPSEIFLIQNVNLEMGKMGNKGRHGLGVFWKGEGGWKVWGGGMGGSERRISLFIYPLLPAICSTFLSLPCPSHLNHLLCSPPFRDLFSLALIRSRERSGEIGASWVGG